MRRFFSILLISSLLILPSFALAAPDTTTGLVPCEGPECQVCHVVKGAQRIINFLVAIASFIAVVIFAYAGFLMLTAAGDTGKISQARSMFWNVLIGLVIVLAGWLIVDTVMKWTFQGNDGEEGSELYKESQKWGFGPWNEIQCVMLPTQSGSRPGAGATPTEPSLVTTPQPQPGGSGGKRGTALCPATNPYCSAAVMQQAGFTDPKQANAMSCIAMTESSGNPAGPCSKNEDGTDNACGLFQITRGNWANEKLHRNSPCSTDRRYIYDAACNRETAYLLFQANSRTPYNDWTGTYKGKVFNPAARKCVETYDPTNVRWQI